MCGTRPNFMSNFSDLGLNDALLKAITDLGFTTATPVQTAVIPNALSSVTDIVALAQTGTGKTGAFGLPLLHLMDTNTKDTQALILCPTRELCVQVTSDLEIFGKYLPKLNVTAVYGGASIETQMFKIKKGSHIIVATPGRLIDLIKRGAVQLENVKYVVLDEADEMLNMGFRDDLNTILGATTHKKATWLFSATMSREVRAIASHYMTDPIELSLGERNQTNLNIEHQYYVCKTPDRYEALKRVVDATPNIFGLIFCRTKNETKEIADAMMKEGYNANALHGDLSQAERDRVMAQFRERSLQLLVATDVAARGIDVDDISHVIHYGLPEDSEIYTHRSGRTGRAGKKGISIAIIPSKFADRIPQFQRACKIQMQQKPIPTGEKVCEIKLMEIVQNIHDIPVQNEAIEPFLDKINESLAELSKEELIKRFASMEMNRFLDYYKGAKDLNVKYRSESTGRSERPARRGMKRVFANIGTMDGINRKGFLDMLVDVGVPARSIGDIDMKKSFLHFDLDADQFENAQRSFQNMKIKGRSIRLDHADGQASAPSSFKPKYNTDRPSGGSSFSPRGQKFHKESGGKKSSFSRRKTV